MLGFTSNPLPVQHQACDWKTRWWSPEETPQELWYNNDGLAVTICPDLQSTVYIYVILCVITRKNRERDICEVTCWKIVWFHHVSQAARNHSSLWFQHHQPSLNIFALTATELRRPPRKPPGCSRLQMHIPVLLRCQDLKWSQWSTFLSSMLYNRSIKTLSKSIKHVKDDQRCPQIHQTLQILWRY